MNILRKLTILRLKMNKKRTIVTAIGIILSTALLCAVAGMVSSFQATFRDYAIRTSGNFHLLVHQVSLENSKYIFQNQQVKHYFVVQNAGYSILENSKNEYKPYLHLREYDDTALKNYGIQLTEGRLPENQNEVILSNAIFKNGGVTYKLGDKIQLELGKRVLESGKDLEDEHVISTKIPYQICKDATQECEKEHLEVQESREVTVVGIMERPSMDIEGYTDPGYTVITKLENRKDSVEVGILLKNPKKHAEFLNQLKDSFKNKELEYYKNADLLRCDGVLNGGTLKVLQNLSLIVFVIIMLSSVFVIKNSFTISVTERIREYGMLASIGATKKQIRKTVLFEGLLLGIIAIPIGIFCGILAVAILVLLLNLILGDFLGPIYFVYYVPIMPILFSVLLASITIYLSSLFPAIKASKISPIAAISDSYENLKRKRVRTPKIFKKLFSVGGDIAYKNLKRSRKKYRTTVVSLVVSIVLFLSLTALMDYGFRYTNIYYQEMDYNMSVWVNRRDTKDSYELLQKISKFPLVKEATLIRQLDFSVDAKKYGNPEIRKFTGSDTVDPCIVSLGEEAYNRFLRHIGVSPENYQDKAILIDQVMLYMNNKYYDTNYLDVQEGDVLVGKTYDDEEVSLKIGKITTEFPMGLSKNNLTAYLVVPDHIVDQYSSYGANLYINSNDPDKLAEEIEELKNKDSKFSSLYVSNLAEQIRENNSIILVISIFLYGFIAVITLIGVTNIFNTITTNMMLRRREFAMLRSVGMTRKEFNRMIRLESIFYGLKSLLFGIPIGLFFGYLIYRAIRSNLETPYVFPYYPVLFCILFVLIIVGITMHYSLKKIQKDNIIEVIRSEYI